MTKSVLLSPLQQKLRQLKRVELFSVLLTLGLCLLIIWQPQWARRGVVFSMATLASLLLLTLSGWPYRLLDEFQRLRWQRAWAFGGIGGLLAIVGMLAWGSFDWAGQDLSSAAISGQAALQFSVEDLCIPLSAMLVGLLVALLEPAAPRDV